MKQNNKLNLFLHQIINKIKTLLSLKLVKVFSLSSVSVLVRMISGFISVKVIAVLIGPEGVALIGQLNNFTTIILTIATAGIAGGVTKYVAQYKEENDILDDYVHLSLKIILFFTLILSIFLISLNKILAEKILFNDQYGFVFLIFGITLIFYSLHTYLMAIINGYQYYKLYVLISIVSCIVALGISLALVFLLGVKGALINAVTNLSLTTGITIFLFKKNKVYNFSLKKFKNKIDYGKIKNLSKFSYMTIIGTFGLPISQLLLRTYVMNTYGITDAGCWEGMNRLANMYLMVLTTSFSIYYLPRISEIREVTALRKEITLVYKFILPLMAFGFFLIFLLRELIVKIVFATEFTPMIALFKWQLLGDFFKMTCWVLSYLIGAKAKIITYSIVEIIFSFLYIALAYLFSSCLNFGISGVVMGYLVNYVLYLIALYFVVWRRLDRYVG